MSSSQVLVLFNKDWKGDHPLSQPGQDSKEVAEHYVRMHTDPKTGEQPYLLGLHCVHGAGHLNRPHLRERSHDNTSGVVLKTLKRQISATDTMRDGRLVEFSLPGQPANWNLDSFNLYLSSKFGTLDQRVTVISDGENRYPDQVQFKRQGPWTVRLNGSRFRRGSFTVFASCKDTKGQSHQWQAGYKDVRDIICTRTGPDKTRDDKHFLDDVAQTVKGFLTDSKHARPDGTLLKDHILFIVISYGLPKTALARYGIARGITRSSQGFGSIVSLEQRLQLLFYDLEEVMGFTPKPHRFQSGDRFTRFYFRALQAWPLYGQAANPFLHPKVYKLSKKELGDPEEILRFTARNRKKHPKRHLYFSMRLDAQSAMQARGLIDRAVYASCYGGPEMGTLSASDLSRSKERVGWLDQNRAAQSYWSRGYRFLYYKPSSSRRLVLFPLQAGQGFFNIEKVFLPGGLDVVIESHQGWNRESSHFFKMLKKGVTVTAAAGRVYSGAPHIHNQSFWDDNVLHACFLKGWTIGESLLHTQVHLEWITSFIGDPLYRLPGRPGLDRVAPQPDTENGIRFIKQTGSKRGVIYSVIANLDHTAIRPEVAQMRVYDQNDRSKTIGVSQSFLARPRADVTRLPESGSVVVELIDPFGNRNTVSRPVGWVQSQN
ncbi:MAG: hypothetical protein K9J81_00790 [Desulfohalobiaceae bacterium]|nr:hypothetical protein [Desulfohalobiaceae bacterium]